jgi:ketosteroid isomerase-like protein
VPGAAGFGEAATLAEETSGLETTPACTTEVRVCHLGDTFREDVSRRKLMSDMTMELARMGFAAWQQGDFATIEALLDPAVQWRWFEPGEWDCHGRQDVMDVIRERYEQGFARGELEFVDGGQDSVIVVAHPAAVGGEEWPAETATIITFRESKVVDMQDYQTKDEALTAIT